MRDVVVAGHAPGERQEAARAAPDPLLKVALQQGTPDCVPERGTRRRVAWSGHGSDRFCTSLAAASRPLPTRAAEVRFSSTPLPRRRGRWAGWRGRKQYVSPVGSAAAGVGSLQQTAQVDEVLL